MRHKALLETGSPVVTKKCRVRSWPGPMWDASSSSPRMHRERLGASAPRHGGTTFRKLIVRSQPPLPYALSLGLANGDVIKAVVAFSPGFIVKAGGRGKPSLFISHGREDFILPVE